ncbi:MAG: PQQ-dependent dehydrogenase, methanol/ethanol family [Pseudomonadales bacterium]|jgi:quinohemoprotein ethanol dehydrogenase|nr:PQQ-dependent dehydrogenase, methanol/ethanol family [Pseudomonadales bacterium]MDP6472139.1 PQQ-dependent dehydrogenase, methanol/ethanol family [Pseudomonadales bacterium]MDP6826609.1 PQQ-dependent dehydrogenase, methanol/ethanol family [Pseudomonadales bacterium]MDP6970120.1 PQQ-dependent dehydrogenase, methanol/ethanol family [Pseudomonadales bacterium]
MQHTIRRICGVSVALVALAGCDAGTPPAVPAQAGAVDDARIIAASASEPGSWLTYGQTYKEQRFSNLTQITPDNVADLGLAWSKPIGDWNMRMQGTPLVVDGVMYVTNGWSVVYALDAVSGDEIWSYDPQVDRGYVKLACCGPAHNRGVAVYEGKVFVGTFDGRLLAINAGTGEKVWDVDTWHPSALGRFNVTGAPRAAAGKVFIGQGSSESGHRRGYVTAYDTDTGEVAWRFYLVPGDPNEPFEHPEMEMAAKTWGGEWWKYGGGGTAWNSLVYDEDFNSLYIGVGNGAPWPRDIRSPGRGDDLFLTAIVSVDVDTGRMNWYYQTVPGDNWDYSAAMDITLGELEVDGFERKVLLQAPKNGFFYVLDRSSGKLLRAHPYTEGITWATHIDIETARPVENPAVRYEDKPQWILPANAGAHNWEPQSWDQSKGLMYFYYHDYANFYSLDETFVKTGIYEIRERGLSLGWGEGEYRRKLIEQADPRPESVGFLGAFDPLTGRYEWRHRLDSVFNGGVLATTTGLLFQGEGNGQFVARSTESGQPIWRFDAVGSFSSSLISYQIDDVQYLATMITGNRSIDLPGTLLVFKLGGTQQMDVEEVTELEIPPQPEVEVTVESYTEGDSLYHMHCATCHRGIGIPSIVATAPAPDLRAMTQATHAQYNAIVLEGMREDVGMPGFSGTLDEADADAIRDFLVIQANQLRDFQDSRRRAGARRAAHEHEGANSGE